MSLKLYVDHASQPSRAIIVFCNINKIPFQLVETRILKGEHRTPEFAKVNPCKKLPAIMHGDFNLFESHTILRYLARAFDTPDQWYPKNDIKKTAQVDKYLDWHHTNTRRCANLFFNGRVAPAVGLPIPKAFNLQEAQKQVETALQFIDTYYLGSTPFILGQVPSIADLSCYQQIIELRLMEYDFSPYPNVTKWFQKMEAIPELAEENQVFNKFVSSFMAKYPMTKL